MSDEATRAFDFIKSNERGRKPRDRGITEIRGPYYAPVGPRYVEDLFEAVGTYVDAFKFAGGSFALMPRRVVRELIDLCHRNQVLVSTGGWIEYVLTQGGNAVDAYIAESRDLGFDIVEVSSGFISIPADGGESRRGSGHRSRTPPPRRGRLHDHDRVRRDHRERPHVAHRCLRAVRARAGDRSDHVRGGGSRSLRVVRRKLRSRGEP